MDDPDMFGDISRMHQKQVTIHAGDEGLAETGRILYVEPDWTTDDLLQAAGRRLDLVSTPKRMFNCNGMEVADVMMIEDREVIFFTQGGDYVAPQLAEGNGGGEGGGSSSGLPTVVGAYKVNEFLGKGGFGEVRVGEHQLTGERVALKFLRKSAIADMGAAERTTTEIQCLTALKHPNIIRLVQHINSPQNVIMVFELAEGGDLYQFLCTAPGQRVDEEEGRALFRQIVSGVGYAHNQHICHRDMKLDNVLLSRPGCLKEIKLADFGLSDFYRPGATMRTNCGSISYLAPEVFRGTSNAGPPLDVWSIGVILFALLCGRLPFEGSDLQGTNRPREAAIRRRIMECRYKPVESLSPEAKDLLRRMLKLDPNERASIPEIFNHSWLRFRNVTTLDNQPGRQEDRGGLRDAFQGGSISAGASPRDSLGRDVSPRLSTTSRGSNSPRTLAPLSSRLGTPPADCKAPASPRRSAPGSPHRSQTMLDPLEPKPLGGGEEGEAVRQQQWPGTRGSSEGMKGGASEVDAATAFENAAGPAERKRPSRRGRGGGGGGGGGREVGLGDEGDEADRDDKADGDSHQSGSDSSGDSSHTSRAGRGGRGRDFTLTVNSVWGSPNSGGGIHGHGPMKPGMGGGGGGGGGGGSGGGVKKEPMIRMNSRLGSMHPARSKTLSGFGGVANSSTTINTASGGAAVIPGAGGGGIAGTGGGGGSGASGGRIRGRGGIVKSRTMDLSHHFSSSTTSTSGGQEPRATSRSLSPQRQQAPGAAARRKWSDGDATESQEESDADEAWSKLPPGGDSRNHSQKREKAADLDRDDTTGETGKGDVSLPSLSPRSATESDRHGDGVGHGSSSHERYRTSHDSDPSLSPRPSLGSSGAGRGDCHSSCDRRGYRATPDQEDRKSPRGSEAGDEAGRRREDLPRSKTLRSPASSPPGTAGEGDGGIGSRRSRTGWDEQRNSWQGWGGQWEAKDGGEECDSPRRDSRHRLPPSPRGSLPREGLEGNAGDANRDGGNDMGYGRRGSSPRPRESSSEGFKLPRSPSPQRQELPQRGRSHGAIGGSDGSGCSRAGVRNTMSGASDRRGTANKGIAGRHFRRSLTTPSEGTTGLLLDAAPAGIAVARRAASGSRGVGDGGGGHDNERQNNHDGIADPKGSSVASALTTTATSNRGGEEKNIQPKRRSTVSTTESDSSSDGGNRAGPAAQEEMTSEASADISHQQRRAKHVGDNDDKDEDEDLVVGGRGSWEG